MSQTLLSIELSLYHPPWLEVLKTITCGLLDVKGKNQQAKKCLLRTDIDKRIS